MEWLLLPPVRKRSGPYSYSPGAYTGPLSMTHATTLTPPFRTPLSRVPLPILSLNQTSSLVTAKDLGADDDGSAVHLAAGVDRLLSGSVGCSCTFCHTLSENSAQLICSSSSSSRSSNSSSTNEVDKTSTRTSPSARRLADTEMPVCHRPLLMSGL